ncbi:hypothetical protein KY284_026670 [Solanum tuberosum]|nr:hypothetical protein KY284_026670 [Solanum tuberosum]
MDDLTRGSGEDISTVWGEVPLPDVPKMPSVVPSSTVHEVVVDAEIVADDESERVGEELAEETDKESWELKSTGLLRH